MPKYLITGRPGVGKTTVIKELQARGLTAYNTDEIDGVTQMVDTHTGDIVPFPERPIDWSRYSWDWQRPQLIDLLQSDDTVFVGGIVGNMKEFYPLFDMVFALEISTDTLAKRLAAHEYPRTLDEIASAVANYERKQTIFAEANAIIVPANGPVDKIVDDILSQIK